MSKIYRENRLEVTPEIRTGKSESVGDILNRMFFADYYEEITGEETKQGAGHAGAKQIDRLIEAD